MGGVTTVAPLLDDMTAFAESRSDFLRYAEVFAMDSHSVPPEGVAAISKLLQLFFVTLSTLLWKDHGFLFRGRLVVDMTRYAMNTILSVLRLYPRLEKSGGSFLVAGNTETHIDFIGFLFGHSCTSCDR
jgi:hypothetical protein